jgi:hypothetical protein
VAYRPVYSGNGRIIGRRTNLSADEAPPVDNLITDFSIVDNWTLEPTIA